MGKLFHSSDFVALLLAVVLLPLPVATISFALIVLARHSLKWCRLSSNILSDLLLGEFEVLETSDIKNERVRLCAVMGLAIFVMLAWENIFLLDDIYGRAQAFFFLLLPVAVIIRNGIIFLLSRVFHFGVLSTLE